MTLSHLIEQVETHAAVILSSVLHDLKTDKDLKAINQLPESELRAWGERIVRRLGQYLLTRDENLAKQYEDLGRARFEQHIPLFEMVRALHLLKNRTVDYVRDQGVTSSLDIYAEEEMEHFSDRFFDWLLYHLVRGYESAMRESLEAASDSARRR